MAELDTATLNESAAGEPVPVETLPSHPLTENEAAQLDSNETLSFFRPVAALNDAHPDHIVGCFLGIDDTANMLVFHPGHDVWFKVKTVNAGHAFDTLGFDGRVLNAARSYYGDDVVSHLKPGIVTETPTDALTAVLPGRAVTEHDVWLLEESVTGLRAAHPTVLADDETVPVIFGATAPSETRPGSWLFVGFHPTRNEWTTIETGTITDAMDAFSMDAVIEWVTEHYDPETVEFTTPQW